MTSSPKPLPSKLLNVRWPCPHETPELVDDGIPFVSAESVSEGRIDFSRKRGSISEELHRQYCRKCFPRRNDIFLCKSGATTGKLAIVDVDFEFSVWSPLAQIRLHPSKAEPRFTYWALHSDYVQDQIRTTWSHGTQPNISMQAIERLAIALPPLEEQRAIAAFLDRKTAKIDNLIAKKHRLDELLIEKIRSVHNLNLTGQTQPQSDAVATDMPWLPSCPNGWQLLPLRRVLKTIEQGWSPACDGREADADEWGVLKAGCVNTGELDESENKKRPEEIPPEVSHQVRPSDVLMSRACGTPSLVGSVAYVKECREKLLLCDKVFRLHPITSRITPEFLAEALKSKSSRVQIEQSLSGADGLANNITQATIKRIVIAVPPLPIQHEICPTIDEMRKQIHALRIKTLTAIARLKEHRSALISAAVTGQIDVCHHPEEAPCP